ncbi:MAG: DUF739 family protein [Clostridia bacterium]|nr:DUF739 family protein [Clostridia bacterium]
MIKETFNYSKLRKKIKQICITQELFAEKMGLSSATISDKLNNKVEFKQNEINLACVILGIDIKEISAYFFCTSS